MGSRSHDFDDELKISFLIWSSVARSKTFILDLISVFLNWWNILYFVWKFGTDSFNFINKIFSEIVTVILLMLILAEPVVEFYAECYLWSFIDDEERPNFLK